MQSEKHIVKIPIELFLDVCQMIYSGNLNNKILGVNQNIGEVTLELSIGSANPNEKLAIKNIYRCIKDWNGYRYGNSNPEEDNLY